MDGIDAMTTGNPKRTDGSGAPVASDLDDGVSTRPSKKPLDVCNRLEGKGMTAVLEGCTLRGRLRGSGGGGGGLSEPGDG
jgi:hypothetical protein